MGIRRRGFFPPNPLIADCGVTATHNSVIETLNQAAKCDSTVIAVGKKQWRVLFLQQNAFFTRCILEEWRRECPRRHALPPAPKGEKATNAAFCSETGNGLHFKAGAHAGSIRGDRWKRSWNAPSAFDGEAAGALSGRSSAAWVSATGLFLPIRERIQTPSTPLPSETRVLLAPRASALKPGQGGCGSQDPESTTKALSPKRYPG